MLIVMRSYIYLFTYITIMRISNSFSEDYLLAIFPFRHTFPQRHGSCHKSHKNSEYWFWFVGESKVCKRRGVLDLLYKRCTAKAHLKIGEEKKNLK